MIQRRGHRVRVAERLVDGCPAYPASPSVAVEDLARLELLAAGRLLPLALCVMACPLGTLVCLAVALVHDFGASWLRAWLRWALWGHVRPSAHAAPRVLGGASRGRCGTCGGPGLPLCRHRSTWGAPPAARQPRTAAVSESAGGAACGARASGVSRGLQAAPSVVQRSLRGERKVFVATPTLPRFQGVVALVDDRLGERLAIEIVGDVYGVRLPEV